jgi:hypothetical protein
MLPLAKAYVPPSRKNRKSITTWQDEAVLGWNYVLAKFRKRAVVG